jgi:uncharacterized protein
VSTAVLASPLAAGTRPAPMSVPVLLGLHLLPGALTTILFVLLAGPIAAAGFPPLAALLVAIAVGIIPFEVGVVVLAARRADSPSGLPAVNPYRRPMPSRDWLMLVPGLLVIGTVGFGLVAVVEPGIRDGLFGWLPAWFVAPVSLDSVDHYSRSAWITTLVAFFALNAVIGPVVEELYFRGFLLPRMSQFGRWAPLLNVIFFSVYHFWSPWQFFSRIAGVTPYAYAVWRKENVYLGMVVHAALNLISVATVAVIVMTSLA